MNLKTICQGTPRLTMRQGGILFSIIVIKMIYAYRVALIESDCISMYDSTYCHYVLIVS